jgi:hypothetical protein
MRGKIEEVLSCRVRLAAMIKSSPEKFLLQQMSSLLPIERELALCWNIFLSEDRLRTLEVGQGAGKHTLIKH